MYLLGGRRVTVRDLVDNGLVDPGAALRFERRRIGQTYVARVTESGRIQLEDGQEFRSPSRAAMVAAGMRAVDGWRAWIVEGNGRMLDGLRQELLDKAARNAASVAPLALDENIDQRVHERLREARIRADAKHPEEISVRELLSLWGAKGRGDQISRIEADLANHGLVTSPSFRKVTLDANVRLLTASDEPDEDTPADVAEVLATTDEEDAGAPVGLTVGNLPSALGGITSVAPNASFDEAITAMLLNDYSQLAVLNGPRNLRGAVTWRSIAHARHAGGDAPFSDAIDQNVHEVRYDRELIDVLPVLQQAGFVFVRNEKNVIAGIVTTADVVQIYGEMATPFFQIGELDQTLRRVIARNFELDEVASLCSRPVKSVDEMTMGDYQQVLGNQAIWAKLGWRLDRATFIMRLSEIRKVRNDVMHFNPDPIPADAVNKLRRLNAVLRTYSG
ncbi:hypothetical protein GCM10009827_052290 [Dactylosporangium maewongense]|uniref:CBS domain-containing protein n=2 Tax=Dactylosporangium maewongense TaxID=634393 RepID=A0ABN2AXK5_9ACTN